MRLLRTAKGLAGEGLDRSSRFSPSRTARGHASAYPARRLFVSTLRPSVKHHRSAMERGARCGAGSWALLGARAFRTPPAWAISMRQPTLPPGPSPTFNQERAPARPLGFSGNARHCALRPELRAEPRGYTFCFVPPLFRPSCVQTERATECEPVAKPRPLPLS